MFPTMPLLGIQMDKLNYSLEPSTSTKSVPQKLFNRAIENIERYFLFVGILEKFDLSLTLLKNRLSWSQPYYKKKNKTLIRYKVSDKEKAIISELNQYDLKLCAYCEEKFLGVGNKERLATNMFSTLNGIRNALRH